VAIMTLTIPRVPAVLPATVRVPCRPALDSEGPPAARRAAQRAISAGWAVVLTYAAGVEQRKTRVALPADTERRKTRRRDPVTGEVRVVEPKWAVAEAPVNVESIALRAATPDARRFLVWERVPGGRWSGVSGYGYSQTAPIHKLSFTGLEW